MQVAENVGQWKRMLRPKRQEHRVVGGRRLQLEIELAAKSLAQRKAPSLVDPAAEGRVKHELHPAGLVEEPLEDERVLRRHHAERRSRARKKRNPLLDGNAAD